jgi:hypothetical protein
MCSELLPRGLFNSQTIIHGSVLESQWGQVEQKFLVFVLYCCLVSLAHKEGESSYG